MFDLGENLPEPDRRAWTRVRINRPCKLHDPRSGKYIAAATRDVSAGGALIEIDHPLEIAPGESLFVGIAQKRRQMFLRASEMLEMCIVRALRTPGGGTVLAGRWIIQPALEQTLRRAA